VKNIPAGWVLPTEITERLGESSGRQRAMVAEAHLLRVDRAAYLIQTDAKNAVDFLNARLSEEQNRKSNEIAAASNRLSILAAFFLPLSMLAAVFGMNLPNGLEQSGPQLFWTVFLLGLIVGLTLGVTLWKMVGKTTRP